MAERGGGNVSSMFCTKIYSCKNANWCARDFNPKSDNPECFEQLTNYDCIIDKTPEQLAQWLVERVIDSPWCKPDAPIDPETKQCQIWDFETCALEWLKKEVET